MFSAPASGDIYQFGDPNEIRVDFDRLVANTGTPQINLTVGGTTRAVGLTGPAVHFRSRTSSLFFAYTVVAADSDADGISVAANAISLNGGSIKAAADGTTDADLTHTALTPGSDHNVDGSKNEALLIRLRAYVAGQVARSALCDERAQSRLTGSCAGQINRARQRADERGRRTVL